MKLPTVESLLIHNFEKISVELNGTKGQICR